MADLFASYVRKELAMVAAHIIYTGIIGFWQDDRSGNGVWALAPDARKPGGPCGDGFVRESVRQNLVAEGTVPEHIAWIRCYRNQVIDSDGLSEILPKKGDKHTDEVVAYCMKGFMTLEGVSGSGSLKKFQAGFDHRNLVPLRWSSDEVNDTKLDRNLASPAMDGRTVFKTRIDRGRLHVTYIDTRSSWRFSHLSSGGDSLAEQVCNEVDLNDDSLQIIFQYGEVRRTLSLNRSDQDSITVMIGNTPREDVYPNPETQFTAKDDDHHVKLFNVLASKPSDNPSILIRNGRPGLVSKFHHHPPYSQYSLDSGSEVVVTAVHGANCPPGWWDEAG